MSALVRERLFSRQETSKLLNISLATLDRMARDGLIAFYQIGRGRVFYSDRHINAYLKSAERPASSICAIGVKP